MICHDGNHTANETKYGQERRREPEKTKVSRCLDISIYEKHLIDEPQVMICVYCAGYNTSLEPHSSDSRYTGTEVTRGPVTEGRY